MGRCIQEWNLKSPTNFTWSILEHLDPNVPIYFHAVLSILLITGKYCKRRGNGYEMD